MAEPSRRFCIVILSLRPRTTVKRADSVGDPGEKVAIVDRLRTVRPFAGQPSASLTFEMHAEG